MKRTLLAHLASFLVVAVGNAVTHGALFGEAINRVIASVAPTTPSPQTFIALALAWLAISSATVYFVSRDRTPSRGRAMAAGAIVGFLLDGGWNLVNRSSWPVWPIEFIVLDCAWHAAHGVVVGLVAHAILHRPPAMK